LDKPREGEIAYEGRTIGDIGFEKYRRNNIGIVFQSYNLIPYMTPYENILTAMSITDNELPSDRSTVAYNLLDFLGITRDKAGRVVNRLSGGEQQRVAIARALATNVELILADEPTGNLNEEMENEITDIFLNLAHEQGKCVIIVSHSPRVAEKADVVLRLRDGRFMTDEQLP
jgi:putative ABC transport system ATP-binding protein